MVQWLKTSVALPEDQGSIPSTTWSVTPVPEDLTLLHKHPCRQNTNEHVLVCVHAHAHMHTHTCTHAHIYICTHTHVHTHMRSLSLSLTHTHTTYAVLWKKSSKVLWKFHQEGSQDRKCSRSWYRGQERVLPIGLFCMAFSVCFLRYPQDITQRWHSRHGLGPPTSITD